MIWHIFRKDLRLLWPLLAGLVVLAVTVTGLQAIVGTAAAPLPLKVLLTFLPIVPMLSVAFITVIVVQQDNLLGDRQDWLVRPIGSGSVLLAKLLFVIVAVHGPLLLIDICTLAFLGIPLTQSLAPALSHQLVLLCLFTAPALMVGAMTQTVVGALSFSVATIVVFTVLLVLAGSAGMRSGAVQPVIQTGYYWVALSLTGLIYIAVMITLAWLQFRERRAVVARVLAVAITAAACAELFVFPWNVALSVQQRIDVASADEKSIALTFAAEPIQTPNSADSGVALRRPIDAGGGVLQKFTPGRDFSIFDLATGLHRTTLPIQIEGLHAGDALLSDKAAFRIDGEDGSLLFAADGPVCVRVDRSGVLGTTCMGAAFTARQGQTDKAVTHAELVVPLPTGLFEHIRGRTVRITMDFTLTQLRQRAAPPMRAVKDKQLEPGIGLCSSGVDHDGDEIEFRCLVIGRQPSCLSVSLQNPHTGSRNPELFGCFDDYTPFPLNVSPPALIRRGGADLPFLDLEGLAHYPVDSSQISDAQIIVARFEPQAHFRRQLVIPAVRLGDWLGEQKKPAAP